MQDSINTYIKLFELIDTSRNGFLDDQELRNIIQNYYKEFPVPQQMLNTITSRPNEEMDFLDFFAFCSDYSVLLSYKEYNNIREFLQNSNDENRPRITTQKLCEVAQQSGIDLKQKELQDLIWTILGTEQNELDTGMILEIFDNIKLSIQ